MHVGVFLFPFIFTTHVAGHRQSKNITENFDKYFTHSKPTLTPIDPMFIKNINQDDFDNFSFVNTDFEPVSRSNLVSG